VFVLLLSLLLSCGGKKNKRVVENVVKYKATEEEVRNDWKSYLISKGISDSLCVEGLLSRLRDWDCEDVEVKKFETRIVVLCLPNSDDRITFWENHAFEIKESILLNRNVDGVNIYRNPAICVDTIQYVRAYRYEKPMKEHIKIKE